MANPRPIIVIRKSDSHGGHHGGAWKVAYADFVTAMMALFIVLWLLNSSKKVQEAVGGYFRDPSAATTAAAGKGAGRGGAGENLTLTKDNMNRLKEELETAVRKMTSFENLKNQIEMTVTAEGLRVELMETEKGTFFPSGAPSPTESGEEILVVLAKQLGQLPNVISIEGHTDARPFTSGADYGNWELSADRANAARRVMQANGLHAHQASQVRGYADERLRFPDRPEDAANRRISLLVHYVEKPSPQAQRGEKAGDGSGVAAGLPAAPAVPAHN